MELLQGDCMELLPQIPDKSVDLIATDPPYFIGMTHNGQKGTFNDLAICRPFYDRLAAEYARVLKDTGEFYIFTDWRGYAFYYPIFAAALPVKNLIGGTKRAEREIFIHIPTSLLFTGLCATKTKRAPTCGEKRRFHPGPKRPTAQRYTQHRNPWS